MSFSNPHSSRGSSFFYQAPPITSDVPIPGILSEDGAIAYPDGYDFGTLLNCGTSEVTLRLQNIGDGFLRIFELDLDSSNFSIVTGLDKTLLAAGEYALFTIGATAPCTPAREFEVTFTYPGGNEFGIPTSGGPIDNDEFLGPVYAGNCSYPGSTPENEFNDVLEFMIENTGDEAHVATITLEESTGWGLLSSNDPYTYADPIISAPIAPGGTFKFWVNFIGTVAYEVYTPTVKVSFETGPALEFSMSGEFGCD